MDQWVDSRNGLFLKPGVAVTRLSKSVIMILFWGRYAQYANSLIEERTTWPSSRLLGQITLGSTVG